jgi:hypothetical protein
MRTVPKAVEGVRTPPSCESGGSEVPFGEGRTRERALSAIRSAGQLVPGFLPRQLTVRNDVSGVTLGLARRDHIDALFGGLRDVYNVHEAFRELVVRDARARLGQDEVDQPPGLV